MFRKILESTGGLDVSCHADFDGDGISHVLGVNTIKVLDDESDFAQFPFKSKILGNDNKTTMTVEYFNGYNIRKRVPSPTIGTVVIHVPYVCLNCTVCHHVGRDVGVLKTGVEVIVITGIVCTYVPNPLIGIDGVFIRINLSTRNNGFLDATGSDGGTNQYHQ